MSVGDMERAAVAEDPLKTRTLAGLWPSRAPNSPLRQLQPCGASPLSSRRGGSGSRSSPRARKEHPPVGV